MTDTAGFGTIARTLRPVALLALLLLAGCGSGGWFSKKEVGPALVCPRLGILGDAQKSVQFRPGPGRDLTDVTHEIELPDFNGGCKFTEKNATVVVTFTLQVAATRGPAAGDMREVMVPYFIAVVDKQQNVLSRDGFNARVPMQPGRRRIVVGEELEQVIPLPAGRTTRDIEILIGLQLDSEQLEFNRKQRGF
jgi:hypothetical protein